MSKIQEVTDIIIKEVVFLDFAQSEALKISRFDIAKTISVAQKELRTIVRDFELLSQSDDKELYTKDEVLEIVRQVLFYGDPGFWEKGGVNGVINFPPNGTYKKAKDYFEKYYLKQTNENEL